MKRLMILLSILVSFQASAYQMWSIDYQKSIQSNRGTDISIEIDKKASGILFTSSPYYFLLKNLNSDYKECQNIRCAYGRNGLYSCELFVQGAGPGFICDVELSGTDQFGKKIETKRLHISKK